VILENTRKFKQSSKTQPALNKQIPSFAKQKFTAKSNTVLEITEIHREEMEREVQNRMKACLPKLGVHFCFDMPVWNSVINTL